MPWKCAIRKEITRKAMLWSALITFVLSVIGTLAIPSSFH